jgi:hypothetical protein
MLRFTSARRTAGCLLTVRRVSLRTTSRLEARSWRTVGRVAGGTARRSVGVESRRTVDRLAARTVRRSVGPENAFERRVLRLLLRLVDVDVRV